VQHEEPDVPAVEVTLVLQVQTPARCRTENVDPLPNLFNLPLLFNTPEYHSVLDVEVCRVLAQAFSDLCGQFSRWCQ
jgi:hypothetical protein